MGNHGGRRTMAATMVDGGVFQLALASFYLSKTHNTPLTNDFADGPDRHQISLPITRYHCAAVEVQLGNIMTNMIPPYLFNISRITMSLP